MNYPEYFMKIRIFVLEKKLIHPMGETFHDFLQDESKLVGEAESISFPESEADIAEILQVMRENGTPVTIQGGKTGVVGSAVPLGGHIMNLSRMKKVISFSMKKDGEALLKVEPGITLLELRRAIQRLKTQKDLFWPPDPSETTASVGGVAATCAKGLCFHLYGKTSSYVSAMRVMNAEGSIRDLKKGQSAMVIDGKDRDLMDIYLGGEGMYGVITALTLRLIPKPKETWGIGFFFENQENGMAFADRLKDMSLEMPGTHIAAMEYLDRTTLDALGTHHDQGIRMLCNPGVTAHLSAMVYVEIHADRETHMQEMAAMLLKMVSLFNGDPDNTWAFSGEPEIDKMRNFLHAASETAVLHIENVRRKDARITKLGIDISLEGEGLEALFHRFEKELQKEKLKACFRGHLGCGSLHIDILPGSYIAYVKGKALMETWAEKFPDSLGNAVTSYGVGKLKKSIFCKTASKMRIHDIMQLKKQLDRNNIWNPGNMIEKDSA
jgi:D-lactate dehydrogenase (cytochrome)